MSGAQSGSVKGIDPKVREAMREAAAREGMSLGEYLNEALQRTHPQSAPAGAPPRLRAPRLTDPSSSEEDAADWRVPSTASAAPSSLSSGDPHRLAQRIEAIERRTQLAVTGLDRAVSTIDRSVLGLSARIDEAESASRESAERISGALDQFRAAGDALGGRLAHAEREVAQSRHALEGAASELHVARDRLHAQVSVAEEIARRAEAAAHFLANEIDTRDAVFQHKLGALEDQARDTLSEARAAAEEAARQAGMASQDAIAELRRLQEALDDRLTETEHSTRRAIADAIAETQAERHGEREAIADLSEKLAVLDQLNSEHAALIARIERAEAGARESTAGLRQAAGAAIADLRNAQLTLAARVKQVEESAGAGDGSHLRDLQHAQADVSERLAALEQKTRDNPVETALQAFEQRIDDIAARAEAGVGAERFGEVEGAVRTIDDALQRLAQRIAETESTANSAIRTLEETVSNLGARVEDKAGGEETEALRAMLEQRLDTMAQSVTRMVGQARDEIADQVQAALDGAQNHGVEQSLTELTNRLASAERRQAQTIEAISIEIKRMSENVDKRLRAVEARNDDAAAAAVREELARMASKLEHRFDEIEQREAAGFDRMGIEVGRLSERLEDRVGAVEIRSAQAIEHVGEQVARMAERFSQRHDALARDLGERMIDSEERAGARVSEAISSIMQRLSEVEQSSADAIAPVQKAVSNVASRLDQYRQDQDEPASSSASPLAFPEFGDYDDGQTPFVSPLEAAQPVRAAPLPPAPAADDDICIADDLDLLVEDAPLTEDLSGAPKLERHEAPPASGDVDFMVDDAAPATEKSAFWTPEAPAFDDGAFAPPTAPASETAVEDELLAPIALDDIPPPPPGKYDYLAAARKAALAQAQPKAKGSSNADKPQASLRGSSRIIFWGAASVITLLIAGGGWYLNTQRHGTSADAPTPPAEHPTAVTEPAAPAAAETPQQDALALTTTAAESATPETAPGEAGPATIAGPLAPRQAASLEQAAQSGDIVAQYELGLQRIAANRAADGVTLLRRAADRGLAMAQYRLAKLYERGEGVNADLTIARQWTERAAAAGNRRAMHDLGVYFARGEGAPLDEAAAFRWFRQAAELGVADSQYNLGVLYQQGRGVGVSATEAMFWFLVAARQGDEDAAARAASLEPQLQSAQVEQARERAAAFRPRAASAIANGEFGSRAWAAPAR